MIRILFVDDEPLVLQGLKASLYRRRSEWEMSFVTGGAAAQELLASTAFDVLVTDLRMPGVDGLAVLAFAQDRSPGTVRIALSGMAADEQPGRLVRLAQQSLSKPCEPARLEAAIERCLATRAMMTSEVMRCRLGAAGALPPMPATFAKLQVALAAEQPTVKAVARVLEADPAAAAKLMQVVGSAFFRLPGRTVTIEQAVTHLGLTTIRDMALITGIFRLAPRPPQKLDLTQIQAHSLRVANVARAISPTTALGNQAFLAGLVHNVGYLLLGRQFPAEMDRMIAAVAAGTPLAEAEAQHIGISHGAAGAYLLGLWGLPYDVIEAVAHHHAPAAVRQDSFDVLAAVAIAVSLLAELGAGAALPLEATAGHVGPDYLAVVHLDATWAELRARAGAALGAAEAA